MCKQVSFFVCCEFRPSPIKHKEIIVPAAAPLLGPTPLLINTLHNIYIQISNYFKLQIHKQIIISYHRN